MIWLRDFELFEGSEFTAINECYLPCLPVLVAPCDGTEESSKPNAAIAIAKLARM